MAAAGAPRGRHTRRGGCVLAIAVVLAGSLAGQIVSKLAFAPLPLQSTACGTGSVGAALPQRRETLAAGFAASLGLVAAPGRGGAEDASPPPPPRGWQIKLPEGWQSFRQSNVPGPEETRTKELLLAGNPQQGAEVKVLRIPLVTTPQDPQGLGSLALIEYFSSAEPRITQDQVLDVLSKAFARQPATFAFALKGNGENKVKSKQKYFMYEFDLTRCEGAQVQGLNGKICQRSDNGEVLPTRVIHHAVINTVTAEPGGGRFQGGAYPEVLWLVDISAPAERWQNVSKQVAVLVDTFAVGTAQQLEVRRNATSTTA